MLKVNEMANFFLVRGYPPEATEEKPLVSYCRDQNMKDVLVHSKLALKSQCSKTVKCFRKRGFTCPRYLDDVHQVRGLTGTYSSKSNHGCIRKDIIYSIKCLKCGSVNI